MASGISFGGLASGLDTNSIIDQLMALERMPKNRLLLRQNEIDARKSALGDISTRLKNLKFAAADLKSPTLWLDTQTVDVNDSTKVAAARTGPAATGAYQVTVTQMASSYQRWYTFTEPTADGTITVAGRNYDVASGSDLATVANTINSDTDGEVYASAVTSADGTKYLALSSRKTGSDVANDFSLSGMAGSFAHAAGKDVTGTNAQGTVGAQAFDQATNVVTDMIPGVQLTLKGLTGATSLTVSVGSPAPDAAAITAKVKAFVDQYNSTIDFVQSKLKEKPVASKSTAEDYRTGVLYGDTALTGLLSSMRISLSAEYTSNPDTLNQLAELGISTGGAVGSGTLNQDSIAGKLSFDEAKFTEALSTNQPLVRKLLSGDGTEEGFAQALDKLLEPVVQAGGSLDESIKIQDNRTKALNDQIARMDTLLAKKEELLRAQFTAMETALAKSQAQGQWLAGQLAALNNGS
jgi:flagellar hook-associated protein 2